MMSATPTALRVPLVQPFVEETHKKVVGLMENSNSEIESYKSGTKLIHTEVTRVKTENMAGSALFAVASAFAYKKNHLYVALGLGIAAVATLLYGRIKKLKPTSEFQTFSNNYDLIARHLINAYVSKATFMIDQVNHGTHTWEYKEDERLSERYNSYEDDRGFDSDLVTDEQRAWRVAHRALANFATNLRVAQIENGNPRLNAVLAKVSTAKDLILQGQSPAPADLANEKYLKYSAASNGGKETATMWPIPAAVQGYFKFGS